LVIAAKFIDNRRHGVRASQSKYHIETGIEYGIIRIMVATARKITVEIPDTLLQKAQQASGTGITQTVRAGLELLAGVAAYKRLRQLAAKSNSVALWRS